jgi:hypothetical protein
MAKDYMISSDELRDALGSDLKIVKFQQLGDYSDIRQLLPKKQDFCILFYQDDKQGDTNVGHWTILMRNGDYFEFADPYGLDNSKELSYIPKNKRIMYGEGFDYLTNLLKSTKHSYSPYDYQSWSPDVATCGRWAMLRGYAFKNGIRTAKEFHNLINKKMRQGNGNGKPFSTYDDLAVYYTS